MGISVDVVRLGLLACTLGGCDRVFGISTVSAEPDGPPGSLGCSRRTALLCADFEEGNVYYANGLPTDVPMPVGIAMATIEVPGAGGGGHGLYVDSTGDAFKIGASSTTAASRITATFDLELARFDAGTPAIALVVLTFGGTQASSCYVALGYETAPVRLILIEHCGPGSYPDLVMPLPSQTAFVPVTFELDLAIRSGYATLGGNTARVDLDPGGSTTGLPQVAFGLIDQLTATGARVGFDNVVVVIEP